MRAAVLLAALGLAACQPDIAYDSYLCGANALCPEDQVCDGKDAHCASPEVAEDFTCSASEEMHEPDDTPATAQAIPVDACLTNLISIDGCMAPGDTEGDWYAVTVPMECTAVVIHMHIAYSVAWEELPFELGDPDGNIMEQSGDCDASETSLKGAGLVDRCLKRTLAPGKTYTLHVFPGDPDTTCGGDCAFNRYTLTVQLLSS